MTIQIIGAGFGRTGTLSLKLALERLGFGPCYHMMEVIKSPDHVAFWDRAVDMGGEGSAMPWEEVFADYRSTVDWPAARYWRELADHYPEAKVLLSVRDADSWYESVERTIYRVMVREMPEDVPDVMRGQAAMARRTVLDATFGGRFEDRDHAISIYEQHNDAVRAAFTPDRLIVYEVGSGWAPLCDGLGVAIPDEPYPHANDTQSFQQMVGLAEEEGGR